ncbi:MAG: methionyl-tRNA formyltransferase [Phycisphaerae bacterium]|nr:methionyl-tRNA formyltransferase [Phycisphaerae bacterium]
MDVLFFGSGAFGQPTLARLAREHRVVAVVSQPDRPAGRGGATTPTPIAAWAASHGIGPILKPERVNDPAVADELRRLKASAWVVIAFGQKLGPALLENQFAINLHASLLPRWRGAAPINAAVIAGDPYVGNSVITLADRMDAGLILGQSRRPLDPGATAGEVHDALALDGPQLVLDCLQRHAAGGTIQAVSQQESLVTLAPKLSRADAWVDFQQPAVVCRRRIHGLSPWPGVMVQLDDQQVKLGHADLVPPVSGAPGTLVDAENGFIACGDGQGLRLLDVHPAGGKPMPWSAFQRGRRLKSGLVVVGGRGQ